MSPARRELESEKKALLKLHEQLKISAQKQSLELTEQMTDHVRVLREKKEEYEKKEIRNKKRRDEEIRRAKRMWEGEVETLRAQVETLKREMTTTATATTRGGSSRGGGMRDTVTEQQRLIKQTKEDARELVREVIEGVEGEEDVDVEVEVLVNDLSRELGRQDDIVARLRSR